jgi:hypothetical protein
VTFGGANQGVQVWTKRAAGGETTFSVSITGDHGQFCIYEVDGADGIGSFGAQQFASVGLTWSLNVYSQQANWLHFCIFENDTNVVPTVTTAGVTTDFIGTPSGGNHAGIFFHVPKNYVGPVGGACDNTQVVFIDYWVPGGANG